MKKTELRGAAKRDSAAEIYRRPTPSGGRPSMPTLTDPAELEHARRLSMKTTPPRAMAATEPPTSPPPASGPATSASVEQLRALLGPLDRVPVVLVAREQLRWLAIDHRAGFVLSLVDGVSTASTILDVSGMPEAEALRILAELVQQDIVGLR